MVIVSGKCVQVCMEKIRVHVFGFLFQMEPEIHRLGRNDVVGSSSSRGVGRHYGVGGGQWRPALQSISEAGT